MKPKVCCPFETSSNMVEQLKNEVDIIITEIHGETTSEKAMGWHLDGKVNLVFGTHTHVPTSDGRILRGGTAYQSILVVTGPRESVLGRDIDACTTVLLMVCQESAPLLIGMLVCKAVFWNLKLN